MTTELTKAAQQALEQLEFLNACYPHKTAADAIASLQSALTQRPAAQSEAQALAHNMMLWREDAVHNGNEYVPVHVRTLEKVIAQLRDLPAPQQATPTEQERDDAIRDVVRVADTVEEAARYGVNAGIRLARAPQQATPATPEDMKVYGGIAAGYFADIQQATPTSGNILTDAFNEVQALKQQATPEPVPRSVFIAGNETAMCAFAARDLAERYVSNFGGATAGGMTVVELPVVGATPEPVGEPVYQLQSGDGKWIDQTRASYDYNVKHGNTVRVLYTRPAPVEAEPVGEPWGWAIVDKHGVAQAIRPARKEFFGCVQSSEPFTAEDVSKIDREWAGLVPHRIVTLYTRPAPGVPEGFALVPVEPTPAMKTAGINVEVFASDPNAGPLNWEEVEAVYRAMLAAAQAKGGQP